MPPIRRSNRVPKPKVHWEPPTITPRKRAPVFAIYTDPPAPSGTQPPTTQLPTTQPPTTQPTTQPTSIQPEAPYQPQNLPKDTEPIKLFQLFFTVKEVENIVNQTNQRAASINFKNPWEPLTIREAYHYLGCLIYMGIQSL